MFWQKFRLSFGVGQRLLQVGVGQPNLPRQPTPYLLIQLEQELVQTVFGKLFGQLRFCRWRSLKIGFRLVT